MKNWIAKVAFNVVGSIYECLWVPHFDFLSRLTPKSRSVSALKLSGHLVPPKKTIDAADVAVILWCRLRSGEWDQSCAILSSGEGNPCEIPSTKWLSWKLAELHKNDLGIPQKYLWLCTWKIGSLFPWLAPCCNNRGAISQTWPVESSRLRWGNLSISAVSRDIVHGDGPCRGSRWWVCCPCGESIFLIGTWALNKIVQRHMFLLHGGEFSNPG